MTTKSASQVLGDIGIGVNLGQTFESKMNSRQPAQVRPWLLGIRQKGFGHVRIPVTWYPGNSHACQLNDALFMQCLDNSIEYAVKIGLAVILNTHHEDWIIDGYDGSDLYNVKFKKLWTQIATRYKRYPQNKLIFEVLNEPSGKFGKPDESADSSECIALTRLINLVGLEAIRAVDSTRIVLVQPNAMGNVWSVPKVYPSKDTLPGSGADKYLGVQFHTYDHYKFCLQAGSNEYYKSLNELRADIQKRVEMIKKWHVTIGGNDVVALHLGEFGVGRLDQRQRDADIVKAYYRLTSLLYRQKGICVTAWSDGGWFNVASLDSRGTVQFPFGLADMVIKG
ncbi:glycoside hydrolase superfamily [Tribonema minus]|uniref:Glycoside hydrolase superfamily n=1 Tax=Tribonema minus TaxID=303371 RepID=A0A835Z601_9STRA|nr:glycoside hydrolase superfamily [Tribonema minus]